MENEIKRAALYIRVSTDNQLELSPAAQRRLLIDHCKKNGYVVDPDYIFVDEAISGKTAEKRPAFMRMIGTAKSNPKPFDIVLVHKFSRFARNQEESILIKSLLRKEHDIDVISATESVMDGPFGDLIERIIEWSDEYYSINLAAEVFKGMSQKALNGGYQARPPLGYRIDRSGDPPVVVPEEAKVVKIVFDKYVNDQFGIFEIARYLNLRGFKTSHGKDFERRSIEYILQNPTYIGYVRWNRKDSSSGKIKDKGDWIVTEGQHEKIIDIETFEAAQQRFKTEYKPRNAKPSTMCKHWLSGIVKCSVCGRTLTRSRYSKTRKDGTPYYGYTCHGYTKGKCPDASSISELKLIAAVLEIIKRDIGSGNVSYEVLPVQDNDVDEFAMLEAQLQRLDSKSRRIKDAYINGIDTIEEYKENKALIEEERKRLVSSIKQSKKEQTVAAADIEMLTDLKGVYEILTSDACSIKEKGVAIRSVVKKIVFNRAESTIDIYYYHS